MRAAGVAVPILLFLLGLLVVPASAQIVIASEDCTVHSRTPCFDTATAIQDAIDDVETDFPTSVRSVVVDPGSYFENAATWGIKYFAAITGCSGLPFTDGESLTFSGGGTGRFASVNGGSTEIRYRLDTGTPASGETVTGDSSAASCTLDATPTAAQNDYTRMGITHIMGAYGCSNWDTLYPAPTRIMGANDGSDATPTLTVYGGSLSCLTVYAGDGDVGEKAIFIPAGADFTILERVFVLNGRPGTGSAAGSFGIDSETSLVLLFSMAQGQCDNDFLANRLIQAPAVVIQQGNYIWSASGGACGSSPMFDLTSTGSELLNADIQMTGDTGFMFQMPGSGADLSIRSTHLSLGGGVELMNASDSNSGTTVEFGNVGIRGGADSNWDAITGHGTVRVLDNGEPGTGLTADCFNGWLYSRLDATGTETVDYACDAGGSWTPLGGGGGVYRGPGVDSGHLYRPAGF